MASVFFSRNDAGVRGDLFQEKQRNMDEQNWKAQMDAVHDVLDTKVGSTTGKNRIKRPICGATS